MYNLPHITSFSGPNIPNLLEYSGTTGGKMHLNKKNESRSSLAMQLYIIGQDLQDGAHCSLCNVHLGSPRTAGKKKRKKMERIQWKSSQTNFYEDLAHVNVCKDDFVILCACLCVRVYVCVLW